MSSRERRLNEQTQRGYTMLSQGHGRRSSHVRFAAGAGVRKPKPSAPQFSAGIRTIEPPRAEPNPERQQILTMIERVKRDATLSQTRRDLALQRLHRALAEAER